MIQTFLRRYYATWITVVLTCFVVSVVYSQQTIEEIKLLPDGSVVTTTGTITTGSEFGQIRFMQDATSGIALYSSELESTVPGDSILVTGVLSIYRGQLQLSPVMSFQIISSGKITEELEIQNLLDISLPAFESMKVLLPCMGISSCEKFLDGGWYILHDHFGNAARLWIADGHDFTGFSIDEGPVSVQGIWTKFEDQYQLLCQGISDASEGPCLIVPQGKVSFDGSKTVLTWNIPVDADATVQFGEHDFNNEFFIVGSFPKVEFIFQSFPPGQIYQIRLMKFDTTGENSFSIPTYFSGPSSPSSPIEILFNRTVDASFSDGSHPLATGSSAIETDLITRIDQVKYSLDVAMYNTTRDPIVQALDRAVQRGVDIRFIADDETSNSALEDPLSFPLLYRSGDGIMHNKFIVADANDPSGAWLWTGSTNLSSNQLSSDPNHAYVIHHQSMSLSYRREFEEMWGSMPNHSDGRYGDFKTNNTVHISRIGDTTIESYFSPSDETNCHILEALQSADYHIQIGLLLLTKEDLVDEIINLHQQGVDVRVILEDEESSSAALSRLQQEEVPVVTHDFGPIFHHKYAIIDEGYPNSDPQVITGSHNWTWSADNINDENTLIIHDQSITNIFRQEFEARWKELNPTFTLNGIIGNIEIHPNPASSFVEIINPYQLSPTVNIMDTDGKTISSFRIGPESSYVYEFPSVLSNGVYVLQMTWPQIQFSQRLILIK